MADPPPSAERAPLRILLIEDNEFDAELVGEYLSESSRTYQIERSASLKEGQSAVRTGDFDVILLDLGLPDVSRDDALESVSTLQEFAPLVVLTAQGQVSVELDAIQNGAEEFLDKNNLGTDVLVRTIGHAIERHEMRHQAHHDWLTDLPNRLSFRRFLDTAVQQWTESTGEVDFAVVLIDVDEFKAVNDSFGHSDGDEVLQEVADRLRRSFRSADHVARVGGDEFKLLFRDVSEQKAQQVVSSRLTEAFGHPFYCQSGEVHLTASSGIAHSDILKDLDVDGEDIHAEALSKAADRAMYAGKGTRGTVVQTSSEEQTHHERRSLEKENRLRRAVENGEIIPHFQPIVSIEPGVGTERVCLGVEVLARWRQPDGSMVQPAEFISLAERSGLMTQISEQLLLKACEELDGLPGLTPEGKPLRVFLNLSPKQLVRVESVLNLTRLAQEHIPVGAELGFEVVETALLEHPELITRLNDAGFKVFLDDFGTGYSSLRRLSEIPVDGLKIDMEFIHGIGDSDTSEAIVTNICSLGNALDIPVIGEGVENNEQYEFLREHGCESAQGYLFAKPGPLEEIELRAG